MMIVLNEYVTLFQWNGVTYEFDTDFRVESDVNTLTYPLSLKVSEDGNNVAFGFPGT